MSDDRGVIEAVLEIQIPVGVLRVTQQDPGPTVQRRKLMSSLIRAMGAWRLRP